MLILVYFKFSILIFFCNILIYLSYYYHSQMNFTSLLVAVIACNRYIYLNNTLFSFTKHILKYEKRLKYNIIYLDQGTKQRLYIKFTYKILNTVFMNAVGYALSFNIIFSYLYTKYVLLLEEDWKVVNNIEKLIIHPSFIKESILILDKIKIIYGILLRETKDVYVNFSVNVTTVMGKHILHIIQPPKNRNTFTNGASIYRTLDLKHLKNYESEYSASQFFRKNKYRMGFTYKGLNGKINSSHTQYVMKHIGLNSTSKGLCNVWLY